MRAHKVKIATVLLILIASNLFGSLYLAGKASAQTNVLKCGDIIKGRFVKNAQQDKYTIEIADNDKLQILGKASGDTLTFHMSVYDPVGRESFRNVQPNAEVLYASPALSGGGVFTIILINSVNNSYQTPLGLGVYTLSIGCTIAATGKNIEPGQAPSTPVPTATTPQPTVAAAVPNVPAASTLAFSGVGFPGLPVVDFTKGFEVALSTTAPFTGTLTPGSADVLSLPFDGKASDTIALDFTRVSGNLNIGIALLAPDNTLLFHSTLLASDLVSTRLKLPASGKYTLGIFRVGIGEPKEPVKTTFRVQVKVNPR